jgi:membrane dipeptidase
MEQDHSKRGYFKVKKSLLIVLFLTATVWLLHTVIPGILEKNMNIVEAHTPYEISPDAKALHKSLFIIDLHSDSLLWNRDLTRASQRGHVDIPRLQEGNVALQVFSATTKSPRGQNYSSNSANTDNITSLAVLQGWPVETWSSLFARADFQVEKLRALATETEDLILIRTKQDFRNLVTKRETNPNVVGAMYLIEGAHPLQGDLDNLDKLYSKGLHFVGITHFFDNELGGSLHGKSQAGLTEFGRAVVERANQLEMTIDIAHASPQVVDDILAISSRPVVLSHGGFKGVCDRDRNLPDSLMVDVANAGGIVGVGYWEGAVCDASPAGIVRAIRYGIDLLGIEHIALGSDFDGAVTTTFDTSELAALTQTMMNDGFTEQEIRAVMGENMRLFLLNQLPD